MSQHEPPPGATSAPDAAIRAARSARSSAASPAPSQASPAGVSPSPTIEPGAESSLGERRSGVLLPVTALPGPDGIGDIGISSRAFVQWLASAGQRIWQLLPIHPPSGPSNSPYDSLSAFAGDTLLISLADLVDLGLLERPMIVRSRALPTTMVDRVQARAWKGPLLQQAAQNLLDTSGDLHEQYLQFCERESWWLADYVAFLALRDQHGGQARQLWPIEDRVHRTGANRSGVLDFGATHTHPEAALQFLFDLQLRALSEHAQANGVELMGDIPIYVSSDSAEVWRHPQLFQLDQQHAAAAVTGAPPDAFDPRGQNWGMPAYDWPAHRSEGYDWWNRRVSHLARNFDILRVDHFRGFADWWSIPPQAAFATSGHWEPGPGVEFFNSIRAATPGLTWVAEDLGAETEAFRELRQRVRMPSMRILQEGFNEGSDSIHLPHNLLGDEVIYTGTHDYDTMQGWAGAHAGTPELAFACRYASCQPDELAAASVELVLRSATRVAIVPLQDWLGLGSNGRINTPGTERGNWEWRVSGATLAGDLGARMAALGSDCRRGNHVR